MSSKLTEDSFNNFVAKLGLGPQNLQSFGGYSASPFISRDRQLLESAYRSSWIVGQVVDTVAEDMTREGVTISTKISPDEIKQLQAAIPVEDEYSKQYDVVFEEGSPEYVIYRGFTRVMELHVIGYGYNSLSNLYSIMIGMHTDAARRELNREGIYYVPLSFAPKRIPELFQAQWWERADLSLRFYEANSFEEPVQTVDSVDVEVHNRDGLLTEFTVNR